MTIPLGKDTRIWDLGRRFTDDPVVLTGEILDRLIVEDTVHPP
ncbi:hypothetical protein [Tepidiphilus olei]|nr:hypothetical protein [Tepidiphilus olei]